MVTTNWQYWAIVLPPNPDDADTLNEGIKDLYDKGIRVMIFTDVDEAEEWLDQF